MEQYATTHVPAFPSGLTALVVDDNEINRLILRDMLQEMGFEVEEAESGKEAVSIVHNQAFDIVLLDLSMPGIDGIETLNLIRALPVAWRDVPAIAVTAHAGEKDHAVILSADFRGLLVKPVPKARIAAELHPGAQRKIGEAAELLQQSWLGDSGKLVIAVVPPEI